MSLVDRRQCLFMVKRPIPIFIWNVLWLFWLEIPFVLFQNKQNQSDTDAIRITELSAQKMQPSKRLALRHMRNKWDSDKWTNVDKEIISTAKLYWSSRTVRCPNMRRFSQKLSQIQKQWQSCGSVILQPSIVVCRSIVAYCKSVFLLNLKKKVSFCSTYFIFSSKETYTVFVEIHSVWIAIISWKLSKLYVISITISNGKNFSHLKIIFPSKLAKFIYLDS